MTLIYNGFSNRTTSFHKTEKAYSYLTSKDASYKMLTGNIKAFSHNGVPDEGGTHQSTVTSWYLLCVALCTLHNNKQLSTKQCLNFVNTEKRNPNTAVPRYSCQFLEDTICMTNHYRSRGWMYNYFYGNLYIYYFNSAYWDLENSVTELDSTRTWNHYCYTLIRFQYIC
jgi:hypothetical protein